MTYADELAKLFKERDNPNILSPQTGVIKSVTPLKISLLDGKILLDSDDVLICHSLIEGAKAKADIKINAYSVGVAATDSRGDTISSISVNTKSNYDAEITYKQVLEVGDIVLCLPANNKFIIVDKVEVV